MNEKYIHIFGIALTLAGLAFIAFLYSTEPRSLAEVTTRGQVVLGTYEIDKVAFEQGLAAFKRDEFAVARLTFERADTERRDATTQFYIAYSYYRQGWGLVSNDDALFKAGLDSVNRLIAIDANYRTTDETLVMKTPAELKNEFEEGLRLTASDFNPMKLTRERK